MIGVLGLLAFSDSTRVALIVGAVWLALLSGVYVLWARPRGARADLSEASGQAAEEPVSAAQG
ncbi:hypothetical protein [Streptomyces sp. 6-11-2]|uniref:hypothetical protein n=1 Tax=Streptomyces sp. 6-11-2 TaxID=2585753 RepID=UPI001C0F3709|nr:hypothetical protein [Streptomyces sp. 6-11-2]